MDHSVVFFSRLVHSKTPNVHLDCRLQILYGALIGGCANGRGRIERSDGSFFEGDLINGRANGDGVFYSRLTNTLSSGCWSKGMRNGLFTVEYLDYPNFSCSILYFLNKIYSIKTTYIAPSSIDKFSICKDLRTQELNGKGTFKDPITGITYSAEWANHRGKGTLLYPNGETYKGKLYGWERHGKGIHCSKHGEIIFHGKWLFDSVQSGIGKTIDPKTKTVISGKFSKGRSKRAILYDQEGSPLFIGFVTQDITNEPTQFLFQFAKEYINYNYKGCVFPSNGRQFFLGEAKHCLKFDNYSRWLDEETLEISRTSDRSRIIQHVHSSGGTNALISSTMKHSIDSGFPDLITRIENFGLPKEGSGWFHYPKGYMYKSDWAKQTEDTIIIFENTGDKLIGRNIYEANSLNTFDIVLSNDGCIFEGKTHYIPNQKNYYFGPISGSGTYHCRGVKINGVVKKRVKIHYHFYNPNEKEFGDEHIFTNKTLTCHRESQEK